MTIRRVEGPRRAIVAAAAGPDSGLAGRCWVIGLSDLRIPGMMGGKHPSNHTERSSPIRGGGTMQFVEHQGRGTVDQRNQAVIAPGLASKVCMVLGR